jgi:hypothetical protein
MKEYRYYKHKCSLTGKTVLSMMRYHQPYIFNWQTRKWNYGLALSRDAEEITEEELFLELI